MVEVEVPRSRLEPVGDEKEEISSKPQRNRMALSLTTIAAGGILGGALAILWPKDPAFEVVNIRFSGFQTRFVTDSPLLVATVDIDMTLSIKVTNPNIVGIEHGETTMDIFYKDALLGQAKVPPGKQAGRSEKIIEVKSRMDGLEASGQIMNIATDFAAGKVELKAFVCIPGEAKVFFIRHPFKCEVRSTIVVNPVTLEVLEQVNEATMIFAAKPRVTQVSEEEMVERHEEQQELIRKEAAEKSEQGLNEDHPAELTEDDDKDGELTTDELAAADLKL